jgi:hypothetical protein
MDTFMFEGPHEIEFTNGETREVDILHNVVNPQAMPIYLFGADGKIYNWMNIISLRKR